MQNSLNLGHLLPYFFKLKNSKYFTLGNVLYMKHFEQLGKVLDKFLFIFHILIPPSLHEVQGSATLFPSLLLSSQQLCEVGEPEVIVTNWRSPGSFMA